MERKEKCPRSFKTWRMINVLCLVSISVGSTYGCPSAQDRKPYRLNGAFKHMLNHDARIVWQVNDESMSKCDHDMTCVDYDHDETETSMKALGDGMYESTVTLRIVTKQFIGRWELKYLGPAILQHPYALYSCDLKLVEIDIYTTIKNKNEEISTQLSTPTYKAVNTTPPSTNAEKIHGAQSTHRSNKPTDTVSVIVFGLAVSLFLMSILIITIYFTAKLRICKQCARCSPRCARNPLPHVYESIDDVRIGPQYVNHSVIRNAISTGNDNSSSGYTTHLDIT